MPSDQDQIATLRASLAQLGVVLGGLSDFSARVIAHAKRGPRLSLQVLGEIREACIVNAKNTDVAGLPIQREAEMLGKAINDLDELLKSAIAKGWEVRQR